MPARVTVLDKPRDMYRVISYNGIPEIGVQPFEYGGYVENPDNFNGSWLCPNSFIMDDAVVSAGCVIENSQISGFNLASQVNIINSALHGNGKIMGNTNIINSVLHGGVTVISNTMPDRKDYQDTASTEIAFSQISGRVSITHYNKIYECYITDHSGWSYISNCNFKNCNFTLLDSRFNDTALQGIRGTFSRCQFNNFSLFRNVYDKEKLMELYARYNMVFEMDNIRIFDAPELIPNKDSKFYFYHNDDEYRYQYNGDEFGTLDEFYKKYVKNNSNKNLRYDDMVAMYNFTLSFFKIKKPSWIRSKLYNLYKFFKSKQDPYTF